MEVRQIIESELRSAGRNGTENLIRGIAESGFADEACTDGHDAGRGGLANHTLWVLRLARREWARIMAQRPELILPEESVTLVCILYGLSLSAKTIPGITELPLTDDESIALKNVRYRGIGKNANPSSPESESSAAVLHYILREAVNLAVGYADGIPFDTEPDDVSLPVMRNDKVTACFEPEDHRTWWNCNGDSYYDADINVEGLIQMPVRRLFSLSLGGNDASDDLAVLADDYGAKALLPLYSCRNGQTLMRSDRACFDYRNCVFIVSRYPHYRSSYIMAQRLDGKWGAFSIKRELSKDKFPAVRMNGVLHFDCHSFEEALDKLCRNGGRRTFQVRLTDADFYSRFSIADIVKR